MDLDFRRDVYRAFGFVVLRRFFDPRPLSKEMDRAMSDGLLRRRRRRSGGIRFQYMPMMTRETPFSLSLLDRLGKVAETLMGGPVVPTRAKGSRYYGESPWHVDSTLPVASVGCLAYLERAAADSGALRVVPGSQHRQFSDALLAIRAARRDRSLPSCVVATEPGDVILMDEHLLHASFGGSLRRQWRVDYLRVPVCSETFAVTKAYFAGLYVPDADDAYDVDRFPTYGRDFRESGRPAVAPLEALGAFSAAAAQEAFMRSRRP